MGIMSGSITIGTETMQIHTLVKRTICPKPTKCLRMCSNSESGGGSDSSRSEKQKLPSAKSDQALKIDVLSLQSKLASDWFLKLTGDISLA
jgi:hypothetical protein